MKKSFLYYCLGALLAGLLVYSCKHANDGGNKRNFSQVMVAEGYVVKPAHFENNLTATANLLPFETVDIKTPVAGTVMSIHFKEGQKVNKGQSLIQIDDRVWKAQIKGLKAQLAAGKEELQRKEALLKAEGASQEEVDLARSGVLQLEAKIEELSVYVSLASVPAPFSGQVGMRDFSVGAYLPQGQVITQIAQSDKLKVDFNLPGRYISQLAAGKEVKVFFHNDTLTASIYAVNPLISENTRTIQVRALLDNRNNWLPGDFAQASLILDVQDSALVVPSQLIIPELGAEIVFICKNGKAVKQKVSTGVRTGKLALVTRGLTAGDTLLATGLVQVREGIPVKITKTASSAEL
ncbi:MAG: efflux RND transporter periplasmic adaptor subunit [Prolixibacteraceae bacterium]|jgi:membrane fusion protein (multidrug efflux system)|nr:efflux RND transporter periplasmic adaptor subunit [Prolixibacteraceae bacterium]